MAVSNNFQINKKLSARAALSRISASTGMPNGRINVSGTCNYHASNPGDYWIYREAVYNNSSSPLVPSGLQYMTEPTTTTGADNPSTVASGDKFRWIYVRNLGPSSNSVVDTAAGILISLSGTADESTDPNNLFLEPGESIVLKLSNHADQSDVELKTCGINSAALPDSNVTGGTVLVQIVAVMNDISV